MQLIIRALKAALLRTKAAYGIKAGIFAILIDTDPKISRVGPCSADVRPDDPSARAFGFENLLFPPFVLTQTMGIHHRDAQQRSGKTLLQFRQDLVLNQQDHWEYLTRMGRPLWTV